MYMPVRFGDQRTGILAASALPAAAPTLSPTALPTPRPAALSALSSVEAHPPRVRADARMRDVRNDVMVILRLRTQY